MGSFLRCMLVCCCLFLSACGKEEVLSQLDSRSSMAAVVALGRAGIAAEREKSSEGRIEQYSIYVGRDDVGRALEVLHESGFTAPKTDEVEEFTRQQGFVPNPQDISRLRLDHALALEVERLLSSLPGVVDVKAAVRSNLRMFGPGGQEAASSKATVVIRTLSFSGKREFETGDVREIVGRTVPGLLADNISVTIVPVTLVERNISFGVSENPGSGVVPLVELLPFWFQVPEEEREVALVQILVFVFVAGSVLFVLGMYVGMAFRRRGQRRVPSGLGAQRGEKFFLESSLSQVEARRKKDSAAPRDIPEEQAKR